MNAKTRYLKEAEQTLRFGYSVFDIWCTLGINPILFRLIAWMREIKTYKCVTKWMKINFVQSVFPIRTGKKIPFEFVSLDLNQNKSKNISLFFIILSFSMKKKHDKTVANELKTGRFVTSEKRARAKFKVESTKKVQCEIFHTVSVSYFICGHVVICLKLVQEKKPRYSLRPTSFEESIAHFNEAWT